MASPECKLSHISHFKRLVISCLSGWQEDMYTEHDINIILPPPPLERKSSLQQVRQMFTSASPANVHFGTSDKCSLRQVRQMFTSASPANVHFSKSGKCSLRQVRQMFTSASPGNSLNTSCRHCMMTTAGVQEDPGYSADKTKHIYIHMTPPGQRSG